MWLFSNHTPDVSIKNKKNPMFGYFVYLVNGSICLEANPNRSYENTEFMVSVLGKSCIVNLTTGHMSGKISEFWL